MLSHHLMWPIVLSLQTAGFYRLLFLSFKLAANRFLIFRLLGHTQNMLTKRHTRFPSCHLSSYPFLYSRQPIYWWGNSPTLRLMYVTIKISLTQKVYSYYSIKFKLTEEFENELQRWFQVFYPSGVPTNVAYAQTRSSSWLVKRWKSDCDVKKRLNALPEYSSDGCRRTALNGRIASMQWYYAAR